MVSDVPATPRPLPPLENYGLIIFTGSRPEPTDIFNTKIIYNSNNSNLYNIIHVYISYKKYRLRLGTRRVSK